MTPKQRPTSKSNPLILEQQVCFALYRASRAMIRAYTPILESLGLTYPQYLVLLVLWEKDQASVGAIGERLVLDSATLTPLLKRMEKSGLLARTRDKDDERVVVIELTKKGHDLRTAALEIPGKIACAFGIDLSDINRVQEITQLMGLLSRF